MPVRIALKMAGRIESGLVFVLVDRSATIDVRLMRTHTSRREVLWRPAHKAHVGENKNKTKRDQKTKQNKRPKEQQDVMNYNFTSITIT